MKLTDCIRLLYCLYIEEGDIEVQFDFGDNPDRMKRMLRHWDEPKKRMEEELRGRGGL